MKNYIKNNKKGLFLSSLGVMLLIVMLLLYHQHINQKFLVSTISTFDTKTNVAESKKVLSEEELVNIYLNSNRDVIDFFANVFQIDTDVLIEQLKLDYAQIDLLNTENLEYTLSEYLLDLEDREEDLFDNSLNPCQDDKEYMLALLMYFSNIYDNVNFSIAAAIAEIESGYRSSSMLKKNNIFGGMSKGSLIRYKNIEYGILRYVKLLSSGYFGKGLTTVEAIGRVYNPTFNENGEKIAKPSWVANVTKAINNYSDMDQSIDIAEVKSLKTSTEDIATE